MPGKIIRIYDPPMCCPTGACGPNVDPELVRFARDVAWLRHRGADIERYNLAQDPKAFVENHVVLSLLNEHDSDVLPVVLADDEVIRMRAYPTREEMSAIAGLEGGE